MASYRGHLAFSTVLGAAYGGVAAWYWHMDWGPVFLGAGLTALGGMLPDLDSGSGVPLREMSALTAVVVPFLLFHRLQLAGFSMDQILVLLGATYLLLRYAVAEVFKRLTVHRGMFHSIPAMLIAGLLVFLLYHSPNVSLRIYLAGGTMLGFFSHLLLDELCSVDFMGGKIRLTKSAGSALKFFSSSWSASMTAYLLLAVLLWQASLEFETGRESWRGIEDSILQLLSLRRSQ
jgi:hypothetical protein